MQREDAHSHPREGQSDPVLRLELHEGDSRTKELQSNFKEEVLWRTFPCVNAFSSSSVFHRSCKQLDFHLLDICIDLMSIQIHYDFLNKLESVLEVVWKAQIKGVNEPKQQDEPQCPRPRSSMTLMPSIRIPTSSGSRLHLFRLSVSP